MRIRIRLNLGPQIKKSTGKNRHIALALAALLTPATLLTLVLAFWRISVDLGLSAEFPISTGLFSHWQVWLAIGLFIHTATVFLNRYGRNGEFGIRRMMRNRLSHRKVMEGPAETRSRTPVGHL